MTNLPAVLDGPFAVSSQLPDAKPPKVWGNVYNGRYHLPPVDSKTGAEWEPGYDGPHRPKGWMRMSNVISAYVDQKALQEWQDEQALRGFAAFPHLYERLTVMDSEAPRWKWVRLAEDARALAGANIASERGTARHDMLETWLTTGREQGTTQMLAQLEEVRLAFRDHLFRPVPELTERVIVNEEVQAAGRFDGGVVDLQTGELLVDDLKSKRRQFWTMLEVRAQLAGYARATAMWDADRLCYVDPPRFSQERGVVIHMPVDGNPDEESPDFGKPCVLLMDADLEKGWVTAKRAFEVVKDRAEAKSVGALRCVRQLPALSDVERYAVLLAAVETPAEGSALVQEILGRDLWCAELEQVARESVERMMSETR